MLTEHVWVMILWLILPKQPPAIATAEFWSRDRCMAALEAAWKSNDKFNGICVPR